MKALLVLLTLAAILAALFSGGCSLIGVGNFLWHGARGQYADLQRFIAALSAGAGLVSAVLLATNIGVLITLFGRPSPRRRLLARVLAVVDVAAAVVALVWLVWADTWHWAEWPWSALAKAGAGLFAMKGVLIWRLVGRPAEVRVPGAHDP